MIEQMEKPKPLNGEELAGIIRMLREMRQWSQDTLSALSKLSIRTIQRVESGEPSNADTRRALALAFELEDIDFFNKPFVLPDPERIKAEVEKFKREHVTLEAKTVTSGQELVRLYDTAGMDSASSAVELEGDAADAFAGLIDYLRDFRECSDLMGEREKLQASREVQSYLDRLGQAGFSVSYALRDTKLIGQNWTDKTPWAVTIAYLAVYPRGSEPRVICAPKQVRL